ncbi:protoglobin domain-containing protein [Bacillus cereus]
MLQPFIYAEIDWITEKFYANITKQPNLITIIERYSSIPKLKQTLKTHIKELFSGNMHEDFIEQRVRIAKKACTNWFTSKMVYCCLSRIIPLYHEDFANKNNDNR